MVCIIFIYITIVEYKISNQKYLRSNINIILKITLLIVILLRYHFRISSLYSSLLHRPEKWRCFIVTDLAVNFLIKHRLDKMLYESRRRYRWIINATKIKRRFSSRGVGKKLKPPTAQWRVVINRRHRFPSCI